jgi:hypothetical protein
VLAVVAGSRPERFVLETGDAVLDLDRAHDLAKGVVTEKLGKLNNVATHSSIFVQDVQCLVGYEFVGCEDGGMNVWLDV